MYIKSESFGYSLWGHTSDRGKVEYKQIACDKSETHGRLLIGRQFDHQMLRQLRKYGWTKV